MVWAYCSRRKFGVASFKIPQGDNDLNSKWMHGHIVFSRH